MKKDKQIKEFAYCVDCFLDVYYEEGYKFKHLELNEHCMDNCEKCGEFRRVVMGVKPNIFTRFYYSLEGFVSLHPVLSLPILIILSPILLPISWYRTRELRAEKRKRKNIDK